MVGSTDKYLKFFKIDGEKNSKQQGVRFGDMSISDASFVGKSLEQVVVVGRKPFFYTYDISSGKSLKIPGLMHKGLKSHEVMCVSPLGSKIAFAGCGCYIHIICGTQKTFIMDIKMNTAVRCLTFVDEETLITSGLDADVYVWDLRYSGQGRCIGKFHHDDGSCSSSLAVHRDGSNGNSYLAIGTESGVVTIFNADNSFITRSVDAPIKLKSMLNLTMKITNLSFHPSGQILAMSSDQARDQLRISHTQSCSVFSNWPTDRTPVRRVTSLDFSPGGGFFAVGNNRGKVLLYRVNQFSQA